MSSTNNSLNNNCEKKNRQVVVENRVREVDDDDVDEAIINGVRERPYLYDTRRFGYGNACKSDNSFSAIGNQLNMTCDEVAKRWKALRDRYEREKRMTGTSKKWRFFSQLSFLNEPLKCKRSSTNICDNMDISESSPSEQCSSDENNHEDRSECCSPSFHNSIPSPKRRRTMNGGNYDARSNVNRAKKNSSCRAQTSETMDAETAFGIAISQRLKRLSTRQSGLAQYQIQKLLYEVEFEPFEDVEYQRNFHPRRQNEQSNKRRRRYLSRHSDSGSDITSPSQSSRPMTVHQQHRNCYTDAGCSSLVNVVDESDLFDDVPHTDVSLKKLSHASPTQLDTQELTYIGEFENSVAALSTHNKDSEVLIPSDSCNLHQLNGASEIQPEVRNPAELNSHSQSCKPFIGNPELKAYAGSNNSTQFPTTSNRQLLEANLSKQEAISQRFNSFEQLMLKLFMKVSGDGSAVTEKDLPPLPCRQTADLNFLEAWVVDATNKEKLISYLSKFGGTNKSVAYNIRHILGKLISNDLANQVNWSGANNKLKFRNLSLAEVVYAAVQSINADAKVDDCQDIMKIWFRYSKDRGGGRNKRKIKEPI